MPGGTESLSRKQSFPKAVRLRPPHQQPKTMKVMRMNRFNIAGMALSLLLAVSCSFKEERTGCPCWLTMELSDVKRVSDKASIELLEDGEIIYSDMASGKDIANGQFERTVLKGIVRTSVCSGAARVSSSKAFFNKGNKVDTVWAHTAEVDCTGETAVDIVRMHRQFAHVTLRFLDRESAQGIDALSVSTDCGGLDLMTLSPLPGDWGMALELSDGGTTGFFVPRLRQDGRLVLTVTSAGKEKDEIDLHRLLEDAGYRWDREDLDDVTVGLDFNLGVVGIRIDPWKEGQKYEENI